MTVFIKLSKVGSVGLFSEEDGRLRQVTLISSVFSHEFAKSALPNCTKNILLMIGQWVIQSCYTVWQGRTYMAIKLLHITHPVWIIIYKLCFTTQSDTSGTLNATESSTPNFITNWPPIWSFLAQQNESIINLVQFLCVCFEIVGSPPLWAPLHIKGQLESNFLHSQVAI